MQATNATFLMLSTLSVPMIFATRAATSAPPTGQAFTGASPFTMAAASPEHPGYPHPPQLFPGRAAVIFSSLSSTFTVNAIPASPRNIPTNIPTHAVTSVAISITDISNPLQIKVIRKIPRKL